MWEVMFKRIIWRKNLPYSRFDSFLKVAIIQWKGSLSWHPTTSKIPDEYKTIVSCSLLNPFPFQTNSKRLTFNPWELSRMTASTTRRAAEVRRRRKTKNPENRVPELRTGARPERCRRFPEFVEVSVTQTVCRPDRRRSRNSVFRRIKNRNLQR